MASYQPPNYINNLNQFIPTFNTSNFVEPNESSGNSINLTALDQRYLKKITNDATNNNLSVNGNLFASTLNSDSANFLETNINGPLYVLDTFESFSNNNIFDYNITVSQNSNLNNVNVSGTSSLNKTNIEKLNVNKIDKTYKEYNYPYYSYLDFSDSNNLGYDASGNNKEPINYSVLSLDNYNGRTYIAQFTQANTSSFIPETNTSQVQRINYNNYIPELITKDNISFSFWYYHTQKANTNCILSIGSKQYINHHMDIWVSSNSNTLNARIRYNNNTQAFQLSTSLLIVDAWNFVVVSLGTGGARMFLNNSTVAADISTATLKTLNSISPITDANVGASLAFLTTGPQYRWMFNGYISDFTIWDSYITDLTFIDKLYNENQFGYKVIILAGQSNCLSQGRGVYEASIDDINNYPMLKNRVFQFPMTNLDANYAVINSSIIQANNVLSAWGAQLNVMNGFIQFCEKIITVLKPREKILLMPTSRGGTGFTGTPNWDPDGTTLYLGMINATNYVLNMSPLNKLICFTWLQGENESNGLYGNYLTYFYNKLTTDMLQFSNTVFIMGEIRPTSDGKAQLNNVLKSFANNTNKFLVECGYLPSNDGDTTHYNNVALRRIGEMFGDTYINYITGVDFNKGTFISEAYAENLYIDNNVLTNSIINLGATTFNSTLSISGATTLQSNLVVNKAVSIFSTLYTSDILTIPRLTFGQSELKYYEEGTFQALFVNPLVSGTGTYTNNNCYYTRIGRVQYVSVQFMFNNNANTYSSNNIEIALGGLSKPVSNKNAFSMGYCTNLIDNGVDKHQIVFTSGSNTNVFLFRNNGVYPSNAKYNELSSGTMEIQFSGFYFI